MAMAAVSVASAGVLTTVSPASAAPNPVPADSVHATIPVGTNRTVLVEWEHSPSTVDNYVVVIDKDGRVPWDYQYSVEPTETEFLAENIAPGTYGVWVIAENAGVGSPAVEAQESPILVSGPAPAPAVNPWLADPLRPYTTYSALIDGEFTDWTACGEDGRGPRMDEELFWEHYFSLPTYTSMPSTQAQVQNYTDQQIFDQVPSWSRYTGADVTEGAWQSYYYRNAWAWEAEVITRAGVTSERGDVNLDGTFDAAERLASARRASQAGRNGVIMGRRHLLVKSLAEDAAQTEGPAFRLYRAYFDRTPDFGGFCFWSQALRGGWSLLDVSDFFVNSSEFVSRYGEYETFAPEGPKTDAAEFVALIYRNVLDRDPDAAGFSFWTRQLQDGRYSPAEVMIGFSESKEFEQDTALEFGTALVMAHKKDRLPTADEYVEAGDYWAGLAGVFDPNPTTVPESPAFFGSYYLYVLDYK